MDPNELAKMIDQYFDGELDSGREKEFFISLSADETARNYFKQHHLLKSVVLEMQENFPGNIEKKILSKTLSYEKKSFFGQKIKPFLVYAAVVIFFSLSLFFYNESNAYKNNIAKINYKLDLQRKTIESIVNSLPTAEVKGVHQEEIREIVIKSTKL